MKKYLIGGALALMAGLFVTSCTHDDVYDNSDIVQKKTEDFQKAFTRAFGTINPNQTWGFDRTKEYEDLDQGNTRTTVTNWDNADLHPDLVASKPTELTDEQKSDVARYFRTHKFSNEGEDIDWNCYWVEFVSKEDTTTLIKDGNFYRSGENFVFDKFSVDKPVTTGFDYEEVERWNANVHPLMYLEDVGTKRFRIWLSYTSQWVYNYTIQKYNGEYYLGFDLYGDKQDNGHLELGTTSRGFYNDYIVRLVPGIGQETETKTTTKYDYTYSTTTLRSTGRILCEDLSANYSTRADFDYNDAVFDATLFERTYTLKVYTVTWQEKNGVEIEGTRSEVLENTYPNTIKPKDGQDGDRQEQLPRYLAEIQLYAAGGTKPLSICGVEVHAAFGVGGSTMVNTFDEHSKNHTSTDPNGQTSSAYGSYTTVDGPIKLKNGTPITTFTSVEAADTKYNPEYLFEVTPSEEEIANSEKPTLLDIPVIVRLNDVNASAATPLSSYQGEAPHMIQVPLDTQWPSERCDIIQAYPKFSEYVGGGAEPWSDQNGLDYRYQQEKSLSSYVKGDQDIQTSSSGSVTETIYYTSQDGYDLDERSLYFANTNILNGLADGDRIRVYVKDVSAGYILTLSNGNSDRLLTDQSQLAGKSSGYIDFGMSQYIINSLNSGSSNAAFILSGTKVKVTKICVVKK